MVSIGDIRAWQPDALDAAFDALTSRQDTLLGLADELDAARVPPGWSGDAASSAASWHGTLAERTRRIVAGCRRCVGRWGDFGCGGRRRTGAG